MCKVFSQFNFQFALSQQCIGAVFTGPSCIIPSVVSGIPEAHNVIGLQIVCYTVSQKNRPTFGKVINEKCRWSFFMTHSVHVLHV